MRVVPSPQSPSRNKMPTQEGIESMLHIAHSVYGKYKAISIPADVVVPKKAFLGVLSRKYAIRLFYTIELNLIILLKKRHPQVSHSIDLRKFFVQKEFTRT